MNAQENFKGVIPMERSLFALLICIMIASCGTPMGVREERPLQEDKPQISEYNIDKPYHKNVIAQYDIILQKVERPVEAKERYGEQAITQVEEEGIFKYYFEDQMVEIVWMPTAEQFSFILKNKTTHSIKIIWDEAAYVNENGESQRVIHSGVKYIDRNNLQPPSIVVRSGTISDIIIPSENIYYDEEWRERPLFPTTSSWGGAELFESHLKKYLGKTIQVLLPLQIEDVINEYIFIFEIKDIEVSEVTYSPTD